MKYIIEENRIYAVEDGNEVDGGMPVAFVSFPQREGIFVINHTYVDESLRGSGIGKQLLLACLYAMKEEGYGYAAIGWCDHAAPFYAHAVGAVPIEGSDPEHTVYSRMIRFS